MSVTTVSGQTVGMAIGFTVAILLVAGLVIWWFCRDKGNHGRATDQGETGLGGGRGRGRRYNPFNNDEGEIWGDL